MKKLYPLLTALLALCLIGCERSEAATIVGDLSPGVTTVTAVALVDYTDNGLLEVPLTMYYHAPATGFASVNSTVLQMGVQFEDPLYDPRAERWNEWPQLFFTDGVPVSLRFSVSNPFEGVYLLDVASTLSWNQQYGDVVVDGWSAPLFAVTAADRTVIPEPATFTFIGALLLIGLCVLHRKHRI